MNVKHPLWSCVWSRGPQGAVAGVVLDGIVVVVVVVVVGGGGSVLGRSVQPSGERFKESGDLGAVLCLS